MEIKIEKSILKPLLSREEGIALVDENLTPSNAVMKEELSKKLGKNADLIVVKRINQTYGEGKVEVDFYVYENQESLKRFEKESKKAKKAAAAAAQAQAQPAAGAA